MKPNTVPSALIAGLAVVLFADPSNAASDCSDGKTLVDGTLTIATGNPAYFPWVIDNDPSSGKGFEGAVAYEVAKRMGFAAGNPTLIAALARIKSYLDYGAFTPIQVAAVEALNGDQSSIDATRHRYRERRDVLVKGLTAAGWQIPSPPATMFVWAPIPERFHNLGSLEFSKLLLTEAGVAVAPGIGFGEYGEGYVRLGLVENRQRIRQAVRSIKAFLARASKSETAERAVA